LFNSITAHPAFHTFSVPQKYSKLQRLLAFQDFVLLNQ
jgi:hypothetical protein